MNNPFIIAGHIVPLTLDGSVIPLPDFPTRIQTITFKLTTDATVADRMVVLYWYSSSLAILQTTPANAYQTATKTIIYSGAVGLTYSLDAAGTRAEFPIPDIVLAPFSSLKVSIVDAIGTDALTDFYATVLRV